MCKMQFYRNNIFLSAKLLVTQSAHSFQNVKLFGISDGNFQRLNFAISFQYSESTYL